MNLLHNIWETYAAMHERIRSCNRKHCGTIEYVALPTGYNATLKSEEEMGLTDLCGVVPPGLILCLDDLLDAVHLLLILFTVSHGTFFGLSQSRLQDLHTLSSCTQAFLQFGQLTS